MSPNRNKVGITKIKVGITKHIVAIIKTNVGYTKNKVGITNIKVDILKNKKKSSPHQASITSVRLRKTKCDRSIPQMSFLLKIKPKKSINLTACSFNDI